MGRARLAQDSGLGGPGVGDPNASDALTTRDQVASWSLGLGVLVVYLATFASVPTSDGLSFIAMLDQAAAVGTDRLLKISNAPFSYYQAFLLKRASLALHLDIPTLWLLQVPNAVVTALACAIFYRTIRRVGGPPFWAAAGTLLIATSYGVWYFANGEVHHVALSLLIFLFYQIVLISQSVEGPSPYAKLIGLGFLNAVAVFFHQEHFLFGLAATALLLVGRPWRRGIREVIAYGLAGTVGTGLLIVLVGRFLAGARTLGEIGAWYFWQLGYLAHDYEAEPLRVIVARLVKGQLTAFVYGVQAIADAVRSPDLLGSWTVRLVIGATLAALILAGVLATGLWTERRRIGGALRSVAAGAAVWLVVYPVLLSWYFPAVTEYYLKTVPPLVLLLLVAPIARERAGLPGIGYRLVGAALLVLVVGVNVISAIAPWYRYGVMRERVHAAAAATFRHGDLVISIESGIDSVLERHVDQLHIKELLYREGKRRGFETIVATIASRLGAGHRVFLHNILPSQWALHGLNEPTRNPCRDRYVTRDFEDLLFEVRQRYELVPVITYWEESKEPLYLFGQRLEPILEVRRRA